MARTTKKQTDKPSGKTPSKHKGRQGSQGERARTGSTDAEGSPDQKEKARTDDTGDPQEARSGKDESGKGESKQVIKIRPDQDGGKQTAKADDATSAQKAKTDDGTAKQKTKTDGTKSKSAAKRSEEVPSSLPRTEDPTSEPTTRDGRDGQALRQETSEAKKTSRDEVEGKQGRAGDEAERAQRASGKVDGQATPLQETEQLPDDMVPPEDYDKSKDPVWPGNTTIDDPAISVRHLTKAFNGNVVLEDVSLDVPRGQITVVLGPSGAGKSVFLRHLLGLLKPDEGEIWVEDQNLTKLKRRKLYDLRKKFGVLFQDGALFGSMTLFENTAFPLHEHTKKSKNEIQRIVDEKLEMVGLEGAKDKLPGELSGGMRKRAGLARALVLDPEIIMFDEPDSGLDPVRTAILNELILDLNEQLGSTMIIVTHDIRTADKIADYVGLLFRHRMVAFGTKEDMFKSPYPPVKQFLEGRTHGPIGMSSERDQPELL